MICCVHAGFSADAVETEQHFDAFNIGAFDWKFVLHNPEREALFLAKKVLHAKNSEALDVSCFTLLA